MARTLAHFTTREEACPYLDGPLAAFEYRICVDLQPVELEALLARGWRRFGPSVFRPVCRGCAECVGIRVPVPTFRETRSQARARRKCHSFRLEVGVPRVDEQRLSLYAAWHAAREMQRGWRPNPVDQERYSLDFCFPSETAREIAWFEGERLIAIDLVDETPHALSSVFFFFDPAYRKFSLGVASVVHELELARARGLDHLYLGFRVMGCPSMAYKEQYRPHELLVGRPELDEAPQWRPG